MLEVAYLCRSFGKLAAVRGVSFKVEPGQIRGLIGPNGSGKTTIFNLLSGFLKPTSGEVRLHGRKISGLRPHQIAAHGLVRTFQLTSLYRELTVFENVELGHHLQTRTFAATGVNVRESTLELLDFFELGDLRNVPARVLPGGTQRVLSIATAAAARPKLLLLDEPLAGLNPTEKNGVAEKIRSLHASGVTIFLVEHDVKSVLRMCDRIVVLNFGEMIFDGAAEDVPHNERVVEAYLGKPAASHA